MAKTISFVKGKGSVAHNNRDFIAENVDRTRTEFNKYYVKEPIEKAYDKCFGQALAEYNERQTRSDRKKGDYITEIRNSKNGEKLFYENVVQIGDKNDTGIFREGDGGMDEAFEAAAVLQEYALTFQERNPNLYLFNAVLHMDEATPHLHLDYIPVAHGYKKGMETRNSLTKALQQMGIPKAASHDRNETVFWQERERKFIKELCEEKGIEIYEKGVKRNDLTLPEYKDAMRRVDEMDLEVEMEKERLEKLNQKEEALKQQVSKYEVRKELIQKAEQVVNEEKAKGKEPIAQPIRDWIGQDTGYVKVKKEDWRDLKKAFRSYKTKLKLMDTYEEKISGLSKKLTEQTSMIGKCKQFLEKNNLLEKFKNFLRPQKESILAKLEKGRQEQIAREKMRETREPHRTIKKHEERSL